MNKEQFLNEAFNINENEPLDPVNILDDYFRDVYYGAGWVTLNKIDFDRDYYEGLKDISDDTIIEYANKEGFKIISRPNTEEGDIIIVNKNMDYDKDILPELDGEQISEAAPLIAAAPEILNTIGAAMTIADAMEEGVEKPETKKHFSVYKVITDREYTDNDLKDNELAFKLETDSFEEAVDALEDLETEGFEGIIKDNEVDDFITEQEIDNYKMSKQYYEDNYINITDDFIDDDYEYDEIDPDDYKYEVKGFSGDSNIRTFYTNYLNEVKDEIKEAKASTDIDNIKVYDKETLVYSIIKRNKNWKTIINNLNNIKESLTEGRADIYNDLEDEYFKALEQAEENSTVTFIVKENEDDEDYEEFDTFEEAKLYAQEHNIDKIYVPKFTICYGDYCDGDYDEYDEQILDLDKNIITESLEEGSKTFLKDLDKDDDEKVFTHKNQFNYDVKQLRVNPKTKTYSIGQFKAGDPRYKTKNGKDFERTIKALKDKGYLEESSDPYKNHIQYKVTFKDKDGEYTEILEVPEYVKIQDKNFDAIEYFKDFYQLKDENIVDAKEVGYYTDFAKTNPFKYEESLEGDAKAQEYIDSKNDNFEKDKETTREVRKELAKQGIATKEDGTPIKERLDDNQEEVGEVVEDFLEFLSDHETAKQDFVNFFHLSLDENGEVVGIEKVHVADIIDWIMEHPQLQADFETFIGYDLDESLKKNQNSKPITEKNWKNQLPNDIALKFRQAINSDNIQMKEMIEATNSVLDYILKEYPDSDYEVEQIKDNMQMINLDDYVDADFAEYEDEEGYYQSNADYFNEEVLNPLYDLCDNLELWIPTEVDFDNLEEDVNKDDASNNKEKSKKQIAELEKERAELETEIDNNDNNPNYNLAETHKILKEIDEKIAKLKEEIGE